MYKALGAIRQIEETPILLVSTNAFSPEMFSDTETLPYRYTPAQAT